MCPWEHEVWIDGETARRFCVNVCQTCGDTDSCQEVSHPRWVDEDGAEEVITL
jgi:hypothetical protein